MSNVQVTIEVINNKVERDSLVERVEVLDKVKDLLLLPNMEYATTKQVADFYDIGKKAIDNVILRNKEELTSDGMIIVKQGELKKIKGDLQDEGSLEKYGLGKFVASAYLFPKRAILRVGMLLRDSEVAKEVRNQLLNIEEHTATEVKTYEIDYEQQLHLKLGQAVAKGDILLAVQITQEVEAYKNRHIIEKANKYDKFLDQDGLATLTTVGKQFLGGMSARKLKAQLQNRGVLHKKAIDGTHPPRQGYENYFKLTPYNASYGVIWNVKATHEGIDFIVELLGK